METSRFVVGSDKAFRGSDGCAGRTNPSNGMGPDGASLVPGQPRILPSEAARPSYLSLLLLATPRINRSADPTLDD